VASDTSSKTLKICQLKLYFIQSFRPSDWQFSVLRWLRSSLNIFNTLTLDEEIKFGNTYLYAVRRMISRYCIHEDETRNMCSVLEETIREQTSSNTKDAALIGK
jgi:hypothetical protein